MKKRSHIFASIRETFSRRREPGYMNMFADVFWDALLLLGIVVVLCAWVVGGMEFLSVLNELNQGAPAQQEVPLPLNTQQLTSILEAIQARQSAFQSAVSQPAQPDPYDPAISVPQK